jgi:hypothetical protein
LNEAYAALHEASLAAGWIWIVDPPFTPDPRMSESHWLPEE